VGCVGVINAKRDTFAESEKGEKGLSPQKLQMKGGVNPGIDLQSGDLNRAGGWVISAAEKKHLRGKSYAEGTI